MDNKRILLVEDEPLLQKLYSDLLKTEGMNFELATGGNSAYEKMKSGGYDLVLLDLLLPELSGVEVIKKLQSDPPEKPNKKIIFLTNLDSGKDFEEVKIMGFDCIVKSNFNPQELMNKVKSLLQ
ncbi:hypothetical protein A2774_02070 [Candidatus Roizmanbacteria bacterium RIFCSPHIGHO2_01_FULL_39_12c]|uniref:Response regulatory domain-containing protein n=1 Tax=Candidatus Roizmanbacteria bacterium RIFCSPHIGHO2_01_FULL_39_12c TaxID=1802031 RepID=A0A1F7GE65_9BACT|nr:MAG: hypothetical protein A2774_02070 [Candidatus Roizmanbacteria bacterium RIFCSPHIGHO2_01_FULL_39_12c]OGK47619.1 MAG: hypothetical protein A2963_00795 [Candidatus Roizmanbacteria bacterium RIFCSPLOWO2_01_FULL_40_13]